MIKFNIEIGNAFGRLVVIEKITIKNFGTRYKCRCECGSEILAEKHNLKSGNTKSCGCLHRETHTTHGLTHSRVYKVWKAMIQRCDNPKNPFFYNYGGRGIKVDERWHTFENFFEDMGHPPDGLTIEREDNNGNYEKDNCRWATYVDQLNNRRNNFYIEAFGRKQTLTQWAREYDMPVTTLKNRLVRGKWTPEVALSTPTQKGYFYSPMKYKDASLAQDARWAAIRGPKNS